VLTKPAVGAEIFLSTEWQVVRRFPDVQRDTFCGISHAFLLTLHMLRSLGLEKRLLRLSAAADCKISPLGGCLLAPCLLSSLEVEFCYSLFLSFSSKDSYKGELRGTAHPRSSHCSQSATFLIPAPKNTGGWGKGIVSRIC